MAKDIKLYKDGNEITINETQLENYSKIIEEMGYKVTKKILVYINSNLRIKVF